MRKLLLIEDDAILSQNISDALKAENFNVITVFDGLLADRILSKQHFDCIIMDINLPGKNGYQLCSDFRSMNQHTPVLMLTAFSDLEDKVKGFDQGADDYLTKPFYMRELIMRINALLKRFNKNSDNRSKIRMLIAGDIKVDDVKKKVYREGREIHLTPREYQILLKLIQNQGEIISKNKLIEEIWGQSFGANTNTIEVYINFLRNKLDKPFGTNNLKTKVGYGYYLDTN